MIGWSGYEVPPEYWHEDPPEGWYDEDQIKEHAEDDCCCSPISMSFALAKAIGNETGYIDVGALDAALTDETRTLDQLSVGELFIVVMQGDSSHVNAARYELGRRIRATECFRDDVRDRVIELERERDKRWPELAEAA